MDRRQALWTLGASATLVGLSPARLAALLKEGVRPPDASRAFFTGPQREAVDALADAIIPATDTPGAVEAGVTGFIEIIVSEWYESGPRERFMRGLAHVDEHAEALTGVRFAYAGREVQTAILSGLEAEGAELVRAREAAAAAPDGAADELPEPFFHQLRSLVLHGYYTSEVGLRDELLHRRLPGAFEGCVDVARVTRPAPVERGDA